MKYRIALQLAATLLCAATAHAQPPLTSEVQGCMTVEIYDVRPNGDFTMTFRLRTTAGASHQFGFGQGMIKRITTGLPLVPAAATLQWTRIIDTIERGAAADRPIRVEYDTATDRVFGVSVDWSGRCPR